MTSAATGPRCCSCTPPGSTPTSGCRWSTRCDGRFHCYGFDQRAHGDSDAPADDDFGWDHLGADVLAAVAELGLDRPFAAGHSSGAAALFLAEEARARARSPRCGATSRSSCRVDDPLPATPTTRWSRAPGAGARCSRTASAAYDNYASKPPFSMLAPDALRAYVDYGFDDLDDGTRAAQVPRRRRGALLRDARPATPRTATSAPCVPGHAACGARTERRSRRSFVDALAARLPRRPHRGARRAPATSARCRTRRRSRASISAAFVAAVIPASIAVAAGAVAQAITGLGFALVCAPVPRRRPRPERGRAADDAAVGRAERRHAGRRAPPRSLVRRPLLLVPAAMATPVVGLARSIASTARRCRSPRVCSPSPAPACWRPACGCTGRAGGPARRWPAW